HITMRGDVTRQKRRAVDTAAKPMRPEYNGKLRALMCGRMINLDLDWPVVAGCIHECVAQNDDPLRILVGADARIPENGHESLLLPVLVERNDFAGFSAFFLRLLVAIAAAGRIVVIIVVFEIGNVE